MYLFFHTVVAQIEGILLNVRSLLSVLFAFLLLATGASAQQAGGQDSPLAVIERQTDEIENISAALRGTPEVTQLQVFKSRLLEIETSVGAAVHNLRPELAEIDSRLTQLGEASAGEDSDISESRQNCEPSVRKWTLRSNVAIWSRRMHRNCSPPSTRQ